MFTIEATYRVPFYRQTTYIADNFKQALAFALEDDRWDSPKQAVTDRTTYLTRAWEGVAAFEGRALPIPDDLSNERRGKGSYTHLEMEAALCVWECINDWTVNAPDGKGDQRWHELREGVGSVQMRHASIPLGQWCLEVYDICTSADKNFFDTIAYDWEVIPLILSHCVDSDGCPFIEPASFPDPDKAAGAVMAAHRSNYELGEKLGLTPVCEGC
ncbi:hypothetical protein [Mesorhizobium sp. NBSH29]|uniref:hypothetical protein n=1 Tax=Mesorhizobium sp. NBSH29 TaxID=2654249 RepID=UPI001AEDA0F8|nr:hypothetical protein [Mesorhizobium sp. NBSH29]